MQPPKKPQRRFRREPYRGMRLTDRDVEILQLIGEYRFLNSSHVITLLDAATREPIVRRLNLLYHHRYLDRPLEQLSFVPKNGTSPLAYGLTFRGSHALRERLGVSYPREKTGRAFLNHALLVADILVAIQAACRRHGARFIPFEEILAGAPAATRGSENPQRFGAEFQANGQRHRLAVIPDATFGVHFKGEEAPAYFFLEADRGTMPVERKRVELRTSFLRKLFVYYHAWQHWKAQPSSAPYAFKNARVLTVVTTKREPQKRLARLLALNHQLPGGKGSGLFLFTAHTAFLADDPFEHAWTNGRGEPARLTD